MVTAWVKPVEGEYISYQKEYIDKLPEGNLIVLLKNNIDETIQFLKEIPADRLEYRYAEGKWNIPELVRHLIDTERILTYRALRFARADKTPLPPFEEKDYAKNSNVHEREFQNLLDEYKAVRISTIYLIESFNDEMLNRRGIANNNTITVNALCYVIAGHELHHVDIIKGRYLVAAETIGTL